MVRIHVNNLVGGIDAALIGLILIIRDDLRVIPLLDHFAILVSLLLSRFVWQRILFGTGHFLFGFIWRWRIAHFEGNCLLVDVIKFKIHVRV